MRALYVGTYSHHGAATLFRCQHFKASKQQHIQNLKRQFKNCQQFLLAIFISFVYTVQLNKRPIFEVKMVKLKLWRMNHMISNACVAP
jgi:hypothetical protein